MLTVTAFEFSATSPVAVPPASASVKAVIVTESPTPAPAALTVAAPVTAIEPDALSTFKVTPALSCCVIFTVVVVSSRDFVTSSHYIRDINGFRTSQR